MRPAPQWAFLLEPDCGGGTLSAPGGHGHSVQIPGVLSGHFMGLYECSLGPRIGRGMQATSLHSFLPVVTPASQGDWPGSRKQRPSLSPPQRPAILGVALTRVLLTPPCFTHVMTSVSSPGSLSSPSTNTEVLVKLCVLQVWPSSTLNL